MAHEIVITLTDADYQIAQCWLEDIDTWAQHAVHNKIRRLTGKLLDGELENENPAWSLDKLMGDEVKKQLADMVMAKRTGALLKNDLTEDEQIRRFVTKNVVLPTRKERDTWGKRRS